MKEFLNLVLIGMGIGMANVIPGVSGGTIALITGVFQRLINALKNIDFVTIKAFLKGNFTEVFNRLDFKLLLPLGLGVIVGILTLAKILDYFFINYPILTWSYFFGLILASVFLVSSQIKKTSLMTLFFMLLGTSIAVLIAFGVPSSPNPNIFYLLLCGIVAAASMILPGISGSFVLILMGNYQLILNAVNQLNLIVLLPVVIGAGVGLIFFSNLLSVVLKKYHDITIGTLTGFVAGSLLTLWPWKIQEAHSYKWLIPSAFTPEVMMAVLLMITGILTIVIIERLAVKK